MIGKVAAEASEKARVKAIDKTSTHADGILPLARKWARSVHQLLVVGLNRAEDGVPSHAPQAPAADLCLGGGRTTRRGSRRAPCGGAGDRTVRDGTRQPCARGDERHCRAPAAHVGQSDKKLVDAATARAQRAPLVGAPIVGPPAERVRVPAHPGNYYWTHGHRIRKDHTSATCAAKATGHRDDATEANTLGGSEKDKGWYTAAPT